MRQLPNLEPGPEAGAEGNPPTPSVSPGGADFGTINGNSSDDSRTNRDSSNSNGGGDRSALVGRPVQDLAAFGELSPL